MGIPCNPGELFVEVRKFTKHIDFSKLLGTHTRAAEATRAPRSVRQLLHLLRAGHADALQDQLRHAVAPAHREVLVAVVEQHHAHVAAVVKVHHSGASVDEVLDSETASRSC